jgi:hypothetical protein
MPALHSDDPNVGIDKSASRLHAMLKELLGRSLIIGWAVAALGATACYLYFIARVVWFLINWLFG